MYVCVLHWTYITRNNTYDSLLTLLVFTDVTRATQARDKLLDSRCCSLEVYGFICIPNNDTVQWRGTAEKFSTSFHDFDNIESWRVSVFFLSLLKFGRQVDSEYDEIALTIYVFSFVRAWLIHLGKLLPSVTQGVLLILLHLTLSYFMLFNWLAWMALSQTDGFWQPFLPSLRKYNWFPCKQQTDAEPVLQWLLWLLQRCALIFLSQPLRVWNSPLFLLLLCR